MKASLPFNYIISVKNGKQYVVFDYRDSDDKRKRKWVGTGLPEKCTKKALNDKVEEVVAKFYESYMTGSIDKKKEKPLAVSAFSDGAVSICDDTLVRYLAYWLDTVKPSLAPGSVTEYTRLLRLVTAYFNETFPDLKLKDVTALHIQQYYNHLHGKGLKGKTVRCYHSFLHSAFKYAVKVDLIPFNPTERVELPRKEKFEGTFYTKEELEQLFEVFKGDRLELVIHIAAYYGLRRGEILGLNWDSIDFDKKTITIRRKVSGSYLNGSGEKLRIENELKTAASIRTFPLIPHIEKMLKERKRLEEYYSKLLGDGFDREFDGFICRDNTGKLITPNYVSRHFKTVLDKNKLKPLRFHDLRHSCASLLVANGVPMKGVQEWLGHANYTTTANYYSHLDYSSKIESAEKIARLLDKPDENSETDTDEE